MAITIKYISVNKW